MKKNNMNINEYQRIANEVEMAKNAKFRDFSTCRGCLGCDTNRKSPTSPKMV